MKKLILIIISALTALTLCACGQEETPAEPTPVPTLEFASGSYPVDAESLRIVVTADEMPRMDEFIALKAVDFTGSDCYEAIGEYIASHSGVRVSLRGEFPNGESFSLRSTEAKLAGIAPENIDECMVILRLIPGLETIDLASRRKRARMRRPRSAGMRSARFRRPFRTRRCATASRCSASSSQRSMSRWCSVTGAWTTRARRCWPCCRT